jgi:hypothetical protein
VAILQVTMSSYYTGGSRGIQFREKGSTGPQAIVSCKSQVSSNTATIRTQVHCPVDSGEIFQVNNYNGISMAAATVYLVGYMV